MKNNSQTIMKSAANFACFFKYCIEKIICSGFGCPECDYDTKEENLLNNHVTENHPLSSIFPKCPECDFDTKEENLLKNHVIENHPLPSIFPKCPEGDFDTKMENLMENHFTGNHPFSKVELPVIDTFERF